jgi:hypothetical protein
LRKVRAQFRFKEREVAMGEEQAGHGMQFV